MDSELIHTDFETIYEYEQDYRISTKVQFKASGTYRIKALLWKSYGGSVRGEPLYKSTDRVSDMEDVEKSIQEQVDRCMEKIEDVEKAKLLDIDVSVN